MRRRREKRGFEWALVRLSKSVSDSEELIKSSPKSVSMKGRMIRTPSGTDPAVRTVDDYRRIVHY